MEIYSDGGQRLANTFWIHRRLESQNPTSIAVANTVTGMAMLARSSVLSTAMPFPGLPGTAYHDRWLTLAGLAQGKLHYVDQALVRYVQHAGNHTGIEKRSAGIVMLTFRFLKCLTECGLAALRPSLRTALPARLEPCSHWSSVESLSLSLQIETLQQRLPRQLWQPKVWDHFNKLLGHPTSALFNVSLKSLLDPYRRHMLVGLALGSLFHSLTSFVLRCATALRRVRSSSRDVKA
jgi:hypothetical protein